jgi:hypothetical protein
VGWAPLWQPTQYLPTKGFTVSSSCFCSTGESAKADVLTQAKSRTAKRFMDDSFLFVHAAMFARPIPRAAAREIRRNSRTNKQNSHLL